MESTLTLKMTDYQQATGHYLGYGRGPDVGDSTWNARQKLNIAAVLGSALRQFYDPMILPGETAAHKWSFLHPTQSAFVLPSGQATWNLPDDFGGFEGKITLVSSNTRPVEFEPTNSGRIDTMYAANPTQTGSPQYMAKRWKKGTTGDAGQRSEIYVYPTPDQNYTLRFDYYLLPEALTPAFPFVYGGQQHAETVNASCLAAAELYLDGARGVRFQYFTERLAASVSADRKHKAETLGYNRDRSDRSARWGNGDPRYYETFPTVTINGVTPN